MPLVLRWRVSDLSSFDQRRGVRERAPCSKGDLRPVRLVLRTELDHVPGRERQRGLVRRGVRAVVPDRQIAYARDRQPGEGLRIAPRPGGWCGAVEVTDAREDSIDRARLGADEV